MACYIMNTKAIYELFIDTVRGHKKKIEILLCNTSGIKFKQERNKSVSQVYT